MAQYPKVIVIGAGSLFFGRQAIWQMVHSPHLNRGTLALVDTDADRLHKMKRLAEMVIADNHVPLALEASTERKDVLKGADFVVLTFADRSVYFRGIDCKVSEKYGIRMCSGDTIGPGGIFRTLRELPIILQMARDIESLCPDAWVINYVNPTTANGIGLRRFAPKLKSFALCDGLHMPYVKRDYALKAGIIASKSDYNPEIDRKFDLRIAGVNHFTWVIKGEYEGKDVLPQIARSIQVEAQKETAGHNADSKEVFNSTITYILYQAYGYIPAIVGHTKEYVRFWQGLGKLPEPIPPLSIWDPEERYKIHAQMWEQVDGFISGKIPIGRYTTMLGPDHATDIIEDMVGNLKKPFYINTSNHESVPNMRDDAFLELLCDVDMNGPHPRPVGEMPLGVRGMQEQVLDSHELAVEAAVSCKLELLKRAMCTDPLVNSLADADAIIRELLSAERDGLPGEWF